MTVNGAYGMYPDFFQADFDVKDVARIDWKASIRTVQDPLQHLLFLCLIQSVSACLAG
jgi:hypothetical protein